MCVACQVNYGGQEYIAKKLPFGFFLRYHIGGWKNISYRGRRGESYPPPWLMIWSHLFGLELDLSWAKLKMKPGFYCYGPLIFSWKSKKYMRA